MKTLLPVLIVLFVRKLKRAARRLGGVGGFPPSRGREKFAFGARKTTVFSHSRRINKAPWSGGGGGGVTFIGSCTISA